MSTYDKRIVDAEEDYANFSKCRKFDLGDYTGLFELPGDSPLREARRRVQAHKSIRRRNVAPL